MTGRRIVAVPDEAQADIEAIRRLKATYFRTIDRQDWDGFRTVFAPDVFIDTTDDTGPGTEIRGRDAFVDGLAPILDGAITTHHGHTSEIELTGADTARGMWAMEDHIWFPESTGMGTMWGTGWYEEEYERIDGEWKITRMILRRQRAEIGGIQVFPPGITG
jgi:uncharacterized protein (TIGR02246 family)